MCCVSLTWGLLAVVALVVDLLFWAEADDSGKLGSDGDLMRHPMSRCPSSQSDWQGWNYHHKFKTHQELQDIFGYPRYTAGCWISSESAVWGKHKVAERVPMPGRLLEIALPTGIVCHIWNDSKQSAVACDAFPSFCARPWASHMEPPRGLCALARTHATRSHCEAGAWAGLQQQLSHSAPCTFMLTLLWDKGSSCCLLADSNSFWLPDVHPTCVFCIYSLYSGL